MRAKRGAAVFFVSCGDEPHSSALMASSRNRHRLPLPSVFERQFDSAGHRNTLFPRHCSPMAISLSTVTGTQLIVAFARFSGIRVKVSAAIHAVCLRVRGRLTLCLCGIGNDRNDPYRKASNQAHGNLPRAMGRRAILSKDRRLARLSYRLIGFIGCSPLLPA